MSYALPTGFQASYREVREETRGLSSIFSSVLFFGLNSEFFSRNGNAQRF